MKHNLFKLLPMFSIVLTGCGVNNHYSLDNYISTLNYKDNFRVLVMGDVHLGNKDDLDRYFAFMDKTFEKAGDVDLIMLNGDLYTFGDRRTMEALFTYVNNKNIPWGITYGNHDEQCFFTADYMSQYAASFSHSVFKYNAYDDVYGYSNYCINLMDGSNVKFSIYALDSNRYRYSPYIGYDYIHQDQIDWYENMVNKNGGDSVKSIAIYHIPVPEFQTAYDKATAGEGATFVDYIDAKGGHGELRESVSCPKENSGFFQKEVSLGSTLLNICSHDHVNDYAVSYQGITLCYSVNATGRVYGDDDKRGATIITIGNDGTSISLSRIFTLEGEEN